MFIDRAMIVCSVAELSVMGVREGLTAMTLFQWIMLALLLAKAVEITRKGWMRLSKK